MIELRDILPVFEIVALLAILPQAAVMLILVTSYAGLRNAEKRLGRVANLDAELLGGGDVLRDVAPVAGQAGMLSGQGVSSLAMIESGRRRCPLDQREVFPVVLGVAARAFLTGARLEAVRRVQSAMRRQPRSDFGVALQALQRHLTTELVAGRAMRCSFEGLVGARQRPRRNLRPYSPGCDPASQKQEKAG